MAKKVASPRAIATESSYPRKALLDLLVYLERSLTTTQLLIQNLPFPVEKQVGRPGDPNLEYLQPPILETWTRIRSLYLPRRVSVLNRY